MNLKKLATQVMMSKIDGVNNSGAAEGALEQLAGGNGFDLAGIVSKFQGPGGDLASKAKSWLGDGANESISASEVQDAIGSDKIEAFAGKLGIDGDSASQKLAEILPEIIDKSSKGGQLLNSVGGIGGLAGFASKFFKKSA